MTPTSIEPASQAPSSGEQDPATREVTGLLGFTGTQTGSFVVRTSKQMASIMAAKMMMMEPEEMTDFGEVADAFGEIVNMISGGFKNAWVEGGNQMELAVPHVVENGNISQQSASPDSVHSGVRMQFDEAAVEIDVHFEG
ncbi:MAG: chemotaxis protein CheX [Planctomycetota bacterium]